ncbi:MAG: SAM-dependent methyltransferase, partial [Actinomycetes bacterium]
MVTARSKNNTAGCVAFVGAGPGDAGLLTVRATQLLAEADVVVVDSGARGELVSRYCLEDVQVLDAGFGENGQPLTHAGRAKVVTKAAKAGNTVVRLLDGDALTFAGLAEELLACRKADVPFEVVPGVSTAGAVPVFAGVPLTTAATGAVHVVEAGTAKVDYAALTDERTTVVLLGDRKEVTVAAEALAAAGRSAAEDVVVTAQGSTTDQRSVQGTLGTLGALLESVEGDAWSAPVVAVMGPGVALRDRTSWFETKPLFGWRVLVPRTQQQSGPMVDKLADCGAVSDVVPTISVEPPRTPHQMEKAVKGLVTGRYEWVGFTSVNAVRAIREKFKEYGLDARAFAGLKVAAVGGVTAQALREWGIEPDLVPSGEQSAQGLLAEWPPYDEVLDPINRIFLPRADIATDTLVAGLQEIGWEVDDVTAYRTVRAAPPAAPIRDAIKNGSY